MFYRSYICAITIYHLSQDVLTAKARQKEKIRYTTVTLVLEIYIDLDIKD